MSEKLRGVNFGGWLVLEKWMTPSLFAGTDARDEYSFMQTRGAKAKIEQHRKSFITEKDFRWLRDHGINAVRIPVGYWIFDDDPFMPCITHLDWAVKVAGQYGLKVLIDLHGAPGSQNGHDHSGRIGKSLWYAKKRYRKQTVDTLVRLAERYRDQSQVWGLELLNEPKASLFHSKLRRFYEQAQRAVLKVARPGLHIVFSDAFRPRLLTGALLPKKHFPVVMDIHWYQFGWWHQDRRPLRKYFRLVQKRATLLRTLQREQPVIIGEWSGVISHEVMYKLTPDEQKAAQKQHIELQLQTYEVAAGWFYWSYKTEDGGVWSFRDMVESQALMLK